MNKTYIPFFDLHNWCIINKNNDDYVLLLKNNIQTKLLTRIQSAIFLKINGINSIELIIKKISEEYPNYSLKKIEKEVTIFLEKMEKERFIILNFNPLQPYYNLYCKKGKIC